MMKVLEKLKEDRSAKESMIEYWEEEIKTHKHKIKNYREEIQDLDETIRILEL